MPREPVTITDVAREAGVSIATVSQALSGNRPVSPRTAQRVREVVAQLGYVPVSSARNLRAGRTGVIGLVIPDISNTFFGRLARGVEDAAHEAGQWVLLCHTEFEPEREDRYLDLLASRSIDGLVYVAGTVAGPRRMGGLVTTFPVVLADEDVNGLPGATRVMGDHRCGGRLAALHLAGLGHQRALVVSGPPGISSSDLRLAGFRESFPDAQVVVGDFTEASGLELVAQALAAGTDATAVFGLNDLMAIGALRALYDAGLSVPSDVSVVGYDDIPLVDRLQPPLTTIRQPAYEIGHHAGRLLIDSIDHHEVEDVVLPVELVVRNSTAAVSTGRDPHVESRSRR